MKPWIQSNDFSIFARWLPNNFFKTVFTLLSACKRKKASQKSVLQKYFFKNPSLSLIRLINGTIIEEVIRVLIHLRYSCIVFFFPSLPILRSLPRVFHPTPQALNAHTAPYLINFNKRANWIIRGRSTFCLKNIHGINTLTPPLMIHALITVSC